MGRKKAKRLKRNKRARQIRRAKTSKFRWIMPLFIILIMYGLFYYKTNVSKSYTATVRVYDSQLEKLVVDEKCITGYDEESSKKHVLFLESIIKGKDKQIDVTLSEGCDNLII